MVIDEDHYVPEVVYGAGSYTFTREKIGTRYVSFGVRILVDPADPEDIKQVHALQDAIKVEQPGGRAASRCPTGIRRARRRCATRCWRSAETLPDTKRTFGARDQVDPVRHLIGTAIGLGRQSREGRHLSQRHAEQERRHDGLRLTVKDVPVDGFWSISVYNAEGYFEKNDLNAYSLNSITAKKSADGSVTIQFGGCDGKIANCLPIMPGWNYMVRLYRPRAEILNGS